MTKNLVRNSYSVKRTSRSRLKARFVFFVSDRTCDPFLLSVQNRVATKRQPLFYWSIVQRSTTNTGSSGHLQAPTHRLPLPPSTAGPSPPSPAPPQRYPLPLLGYRTAVNHSWLSSISDRGFHHPPPPPSPVRPPRRRSRRRVRCRPHSLTPPPSYARRPAAGATRRPPLTTPPQLPWPAFRHGCRVRGESRPQGPQTPRP